MTILLHPSVTDEKIPTMYSYKQNQVQPKTPRATTPPPPTFTVKKPPLVDRPTAKTPAPQAISNIVQRDFKSEYQPKVSSRFPQHSNEPSKSTLKEASRGNSLKDRLGSSLKLKQPQPLAVPSKLNVAQTHIHRQQECEPVAAPAVPNLHIPGIDSRLPILRQPALKLNPNQHQPTYQQQLQPHPQKPQEPPQQQEQHLRQHPQQHQRQQQEQQQQYQQQWQEPLQPTFQPTHHQPMQQINPQVPLKSQLIQDTRFGPINRIGPISTATKAPLSVSQYTQPTPSSNKSSNHQISRAHSEPSIKYQVKVNDKTYKVLKKIGSGGSAKVYEGFEPNTYQTVAIKIINVGMADPRTQASYFNEKAILSQLKDCKHVVKIFNSEYKSEIKELVIVMEKGDADLSQVLDCYFKSREHHGFIDGIFIKYYWRGMLQAVDEIHQNGIVHSDLKPVNFILVKNQIKLIDFGIASTIDPGGTSIIRDYQIGTINYMAPETLRNRALEASFHPMSFSDENNQRLPQQQPQQSAKKKTLIKYDTKADIWSLGCILYNFVYGRPPFDKYSDIMSKVQAITNPGHIIDFPQINNVDLMNCMKMCLRHNPLDRPTAKQLLNHDYLKSDLVTVSRHNKSLIGE